MSTFQHTHNKGFKHGFTLIEVLVSMALFALVMMVSMGAVFSIVNANKKTHSLKSVMTNLNFALESMTRDMRTGSVYSCGPSGSSQVDCSGSGVPGDVFSFKANRDIDGDGTADDYIEYSLDKGRIHKNVSGVGMPQELDYDITANEITIEALNFYVIGTGASDGKQPKVVVSIHGYAGSEQTRSNFNIQTMVTQRSIDS